MSRRGRGKSRTVQRSQQVTATAAPADFAQWLVLAVLVVTAVAAYQPAWHGGLLWDDNGHVTKPALQSASGLWRIWTELGAAQQYYPITHTVFWIWHRLFGDATTPYHFLTIALHACAGWIFWKVLRHLSVPGAIIAACVFVLHPVHAESVAWISEIKNTLSGVFFMTALLQYLRFDDSRQRQNFIAALALFVLALLFYASKVLWPADLMFGRCCHFLRWHCLWSSLRPTWNGRLSVRRGANSSSRSPNERSWRAARCCSTRRKFSGRPISCSCIRDGVRC